MLMKTSLEMLVAADEGLRLMPYRCSDGKFVITFEDMEKLLADAGEACFFKEIKEKI